MSACTPPLSESMQGQQDLLRVLRAAVNGVVADAAPVNWPQVFLLARPHHLDAYLFSSVNAWPLDRRPPPWTLALWKQALIARAVAAVRTHEQLAAILTSLKRAGVPAIPLKGAWLAEHVYEDIVHRPMSDIDLLVRPEDVDAAARALAAAGYITTHDDVPGGWSKDRIFRHPGERTGVELHWQIWHPNHGLLPPQDMSRLWSSATPAKVAGVEVPVLPPAMHLVYLTYHIQAHQWRFPARAHLDLVLLGRRHVHALSTDALAAEARAWGLGFRAPFVWRVAHDICGAEPPAALSGWIAGDVDGVRQERRAALAVALSACSSPVTMSRLLCEYRKASWWRRMVLGIKALRLSPDNLRYAYPMAMRRGGLAGGYVARLGDLVSRRMRDLMPTGRRRRVVASAVEDMADRLRLERWLKTQEK